VSVEAKRHCGEITGLGKELGLFILAMRWDQVAIVDAQGTVLRSFWKTPAGTVETGYQQLSPHIARVDLFKTGHWQKYKEDMFPLMAEDNNAAVEVAASNQ